MKITASNLIRWAGFSAVVAGILFVAIQPIHPSDVLSSVSTSAWPIVHYLTIAMCLFGLIGIAGIYARQVEKVGWLGLVGYLAFSLFLLVTIAWTFAEAFISPVLVDRVTELRRGLPGDRQWAPKRDQSRSTPGVLSVRRGVRPARLPAVRHRDAPCRHPVALGGRRVRLRGACVGGRRFAASARV